MAGWEDRRTSRPAGGQTDGQHINSRPIVADQDRQMGGPESTSAASGQPSAAPILEAAATSSDRASSPATMRPRDAPLSVRSRRASPSDASHAEPDVDASLRRV
jgi:hypothetical protein